MKKIRGIVCFIFIIMVSINLFAAEKYLTLEEVRADFLCRINAYREIKNLQPLTLKYSAIAQDFANEQALLDRYLSHSGFNKRASTIKDIFEKEYKATNAFSVSENCCWFTICADPAKKAFDLFLKSSGHRRNMLSSAKYTAVGIAQGESGAFYFCQLFF